MKKLFKYSAITLATAASLLSLTNSQATSYQIFADLNFANPAALNSVHDMQLMLGGATFFSSIKFSGTAAGISGSTSSNTTDFLPYGRLAVRLSPQMVASFDVSQPYYTNIIFPTNSFISPFSVATIVRDVNYSPKLSYQVNKRLALGVGIDINNLYNGALNFSVPPFGDLTNRVSSWAVGWDVGLFYVVTPSTFLNLAYYSQIIQHGVGNSTWGPLVNNSTSADVKLPGTAIANVIQMFSPAWVGSATLRYTNWSVLRYLVIQNTAIDGATITIPDQFYNNVSAELATHYQFNDKWAGLAAFDYEPNVQPTWTRNPGLPTYTRFTPAVGVEYMVTKGLKGRLIYAYPFVNAPIDMTIATGPHISGTERVRLSAVDLSFTYDI